MNNIILTLLSIPRVGRKSVNYFITNMKEIPKSEKDIVDIFIDIKNYNNKIKVPTLEEVKLAYEKASKIVYLSKKQNIETIDILHKNFPKKLKYIENPPQVLFYKGNYNAIVNENTLAIIGSRDASIESQKNAYEMSCLFAKENYSIISGLDTIYPTQNRELAERIIENKGCLLSEYSIGSTSFKNNFIERDRIESGLSLGTVVIQADIKSGTMHTANFTLNQNRVLACFDIDKSGNKFLLENNKVIAIRGKEDISKIKLQLEKVKYNLEHKKEIFINY